MPTEIDCRDILSVPEFEERARLLMPPMAYEFVASGAADEHTLRWNREAFDRIRLRPRVLRDVSAVDTRVALLGRELAFPILLAPTAYHRVLHPEGELATARGAAEAGATWIVSMGTTTALGDLARAATSPWWFQLYFQSDPEFTRDVVQQAEAAGCEALCLTVDSPIIGARNRQARAGFRLPSDVTTPHLYDIGHRKQAIMDPRRVAATWKDVEWLRALTRLPVVLKGILDPEDAELGHSGRSGGHHRVQSRGAESGYDAGDDRCLARSRGAGRWTSAGAGRWRDSPRHRRAEGDCARCAGGADRAAVLLRLERGRE